MPIASSVRVPRFFAGGGLAPSTVKVFASDTQCIVMRTWRKCCPLTLADAASGVWLGAGSHAACSAIMGLVLRIMLLLWTVSMSLGVDAWDAVLGHRGCFTHPTGGPDAISHPRSARRVTRSDRGGSSGALVQLVPTEGPSGWCHCTGMRFPGGGSCPSLALPSGGGSSGGLAGPRMRWGSYGFSSSVGSAMLDAWAPAAVAWHGAMWGCSGYGAVICRWIHTHAHCLVCSSSSILCWCWGWPRPPARSSPRFSLWLVRYYALSCAGPHCVLLALLAMD